MNDPLVGGVQCRVPLFTFLNTNTTTQLNTYPPPTTRQSLYLSNLSLFRSKAPVSSSSSAMEVERPSHHGFDFPPTNAFYRPAAVGDDNPSPTAPISVDIPDPSLEKTSSMSCEDLTPSPATAPEPRSSTDAAALRLQKVYRSYRTRRRLADSAVVAEELWWQAIDFARLNHSTVSFFNYSKPESVASKWTRVSLNASKVGKGLSKDAKALKLAFQHWIEAIDPRHRYGHNLHLYYEEWCKSDAGQPFFYWLDIGDGRNIDLKECPRALLREQAVKYLGPQEREHYEYVPVDGKIVHKQTGEYLDTTKGSNKAKWIFVMSTTKKLYAGQKKKGMFHHSSFLAGGATIAAGRLVAEDGVLKSLWAYSGHYRPSEDNLNNLLSFLTENGIDKDKVQIFSSSNEDYYDDNKKVPDEKNENVKSFARPPQLELPLEVREKLQVEAIEPPRATQQDNQVQRMYQRTLSGGLQSPRADVPQKALLQRIKSKEKVRSYQLGHQLSAKWCSGVGPRIGCVRDYPLEVRVQALEFVNLSPRVPTPSTSRRFASCLSPDAVTTPTFSREA